MRAGGVGLAFAAVALTGGLVTGCTHSHAAGSSGSSGSSGTERQMGERVSDAESAAGAADTDAAGSP